MDTTTDDNPRQTKDYRVTVARDILGQSRKVGDTLPLTDRQAQYYLPPLGSGLELDGGSDKPAKKGGKVTKSAVSTEPATENSDAVSQG